jgi:hypothetical protein
MNAEIETTERLGGLIRSFQRAAHPAITHSAPLRSQNIGAMSAARRVGFAAAIQGGLDLGLKPDLICWWACSYLGPRNAEHLKTVQNNGGKGGWQQF